MINVSHFEKGAKKKALANIIIQSYLCSLFTEYIPNVSIIGKHDTLL